MVIAFSAGVTFALTPQQQQANAELELMAQDIAQLCTTPGFRGFLRSEIAKSKNRENIIELDKFLDRATKQKNMPPGLTKISGKIRDEKVRHKKMDLTGLEGFDLYIPVDAHKKKWKGGKDFIIAAAPYGNEEDVKQVVGFSVWDGKKLSSIQTKSQKQLFWFLLLKSILTMLFRSLNLKIRQWMHRMKRNLTPTPGKVKSIIHIFQ
jgi:hypothetical protein